MKRILPINSQIYRTLQNLATKHQVIVLCGLPGVGKSLYTLSLNEIILEQGKKLDIIQWDVARKTFESPEIQATFPLGESLVHNGVKLAAGHWLIETVTRWVKENTNNPERQLLIEAPLIGHRFIELAKIQSEEIIESFLSSNKTLFICPIPSKEVRAIITKNRAEQIKDDATNWIGAKPKIVQALWEKVFAIAGVLGLDIKDQDPSIYDPKVYHYVYSRVLKNRNYFALTANEIFNLPIKNESELHQLQNIVPTPDQALSACNLIKQQFQTNESIDRHIKDWYLS